MDKESAARQLRKIYECADEAGIRHATFVCFGTLLGYVREHDFIDHDDDTDVGIRSDWITVEQEAAFYLSLCKHNLFEFRRRRARKGPCGRYLWNSLRSERGGVKSCVWYMWKWGNHVYHCKGRRWLKKIGQKDAVQKILPKPMDWHGYESIMKGNTAHCFDKLLSVKLHGVRVNIPIGYGRLLDEFYPNFAIPGTGASARHRLVLVEDWARESSWKVIL